MLEMAVVLLITLRHRIWRVTKDGVFYADYRSEASAKDGAEAAAVVLRRAGHAVKILVVPSREKP